MFPETGSELALTVSFCIQVCFQKLLGKETALWKSIHSSSDFNVDVAIYGDFGGEIVLLDKIFWEVAELEAHVLVAGHWGVEVEIFDVEC